LNFIWIWPQMILQQVVLFKLSLVETFSKVQNPYFLNIDMIYWHIYMYLLYLWTLCHYSKTCLFYHPVIGPSVFYSINVFSTASLELQYYVWLLLFWVSLSNSYAIHLQSYPSPFCSSFTLFLSIWTPPGGISYGILERLHKGSIKPSLGLFTDN